MPLRYLHDGDNTRERKRRTALEQIWSIEEKVTHHLLVSPFWRRVKSPHRFSFSALGRLDKTLLSFYTLHRDKILW